MLYRLSLNTASHTVKLIGNSTAVPEKLADALFCKLILLGSQNHTENHLIRRINFRRNLTKFHIRKLCPWCGKLDGVTFFQLSSLNTTNVVTKKCGLASHHKGNIQTACKSDISTTAVSGTCKHQLLAFFYKNCLIHRERPSVQHRCQISTCHRYDIITGKSKGWSDKSHLQSTLCFFIAYQQIGNVESTRVHGTGCGNTKCLISESSLVLNSGQDPAVFNCNSHIMTSVLNPVAYRFSLYRYRFPRLFGSDHTLLL